MNLLKSQSRTKTPSKTQLITMMWFHRVDNQYHIHKVRRIVSFKVRLRRICCCRVRAIVRIQLNHIQEAAVRGWNRFRRQAMKLLRVSNRLDRKAIRCQDKHLTVIARSYQSSHLKISNNLKEESLLAELHQRIKFQQIRVI